MPNMKSNLIRANQWIFRIASSLLVDSIPTLRKMAGADPTVNSIEGVDWSTETINEVRCEWMVPANAPADTIILYLHGGGGVLGIYNSSRNIGGHIARACNTRALIPDYRLAPENPFPAGLEDCITAYRWLLSEGISPNKIVILGDSMGGYLTISLLQAVRDLGLPAPAAAICISPVLDPTCSGKSMRSNSHRDALLSPKFMHTVMRQYVYNYDLNDPYISPMTADLRGFPPVLLQVGQDEILLDDSKRFYEYAQHKGLQVTCEIWPHMWHDWHICAPKLNEANQAIEKITDFIRENI
jgi:acetyl esterase/lipase